MRWQAAYKSKKCEALEALQETLLPGRRVFVGANCGEPTALVAALQEIAPTLRNIEVVQLLALAQESYIRQEWCQNLRYNALFIGPGVRAAVDAGWADYTPIILSDIPALFRSGKVAIDVAMISVSPPDEHGFCSLGVSVDIGKAAAETAKFVIAEVNTKMPRTLGDAFIHCSRFSHVVECDRPVPEIPPVEFTDVHRRIGEHAATLVEDGSTLQLGVGAIPNAVLSALKDRRRLGIHSEMFSDGVVEAFEAGVITNEAKTLHAGKMVASFVMGTRKLYDFIDNNPCIEMRPTEYTNDPFVIARNDKMVAINSAISVDLTGQVNADSIGTRFYSGFGGQLDFVRGAARSRGGKPIIALPSTAKAQSRIVPMLDPGAGVVTTRGDVHYVVTEYGIAYLHGKPVRERCKALIAIAHPDFREELTRFAHEQHYLG